MSIQPAKYGLPNWKDIDIRPRVYMFITSAIGCDNSWDIYKAILITICALMQTRYEPCHEIMVRFVLRNLIFQRCMRSLPEGLDVRILVGPFVYYHTLCVRTAKALARLPGCADSPEPSLVAYVINTIISRAGSYGKTIKERYKTSPIIHSLQMASSPPLVSRSVKWTCKQDENVVTCDKCSRILR